MKFNQDIRERKRKFATQTKKNENSKRRETVSVSERTGMDDIPEKTLTIQRYGASEKKRSSKKERRVDALALRADERRDKLRKASGRSKYPMIRRCLNGETHLSKPQVSIRQSITYGREPGELKHLSSRRRRKQK